MIGCIGLYGVGELRRKPASGCLLPFAPGLTAYNYRPDAGLAFANITASKQPRNVGVKLNKACQWRRNPVSSRQLRQWADAGDRRDCAST